MDKQTLKTLGRALRGLSPVECHLPIEMQIVLLRLALAEARRGGEGRGANDPPPLAHRSRSSR